MAADTRETEFHEELPRKSKIAYAVANGTNGLLSGLGLGQIMYFYTTKLGMDPMLQGIVWLLFAAWNAVNDPLLGILEERINTKIGRRVPVLRYGATLYAILFMLVWFPFAPYGDQVLLFINLFIVLFVFDTVYSMIGLVTYSLPAEMAITAKERGSIMVYSTMIGFVTQILGILLPLMFLKGNDASIPFWQLLMLIVAAACGVLLYASSFHIKENKWAMREKQLGFIASIKETFKNREFLVIEISVFSLVIAQTVFMSGILYVFDYAIIVNDFLEYLYFLPAILALLATILIINAVIPKVGVRKPFMVFSIAGAIGLCFLPFAGRTLQTLMVPLIFLGASLGALIIGQQPLMADVIDNDELLTGKRRETTYSGINALITKPAISIANWLFLLILSAHGYDENLEVQPATVGDGVILAYTIIPVTCLLVSTLALVFFKLDGPGWIAKKRELGLLHARKEKEFIDSLKREHKL